ncbi:hypothetical protein B4918_32905 (plasmid) [Bacillus thuringiensis]|uniref:Uncharacterized protein n=1 Tax=Bacillus thuringiensis TaxID=1428 RepID=A0A9W3TK76_BACTU|nr:hypothetical protein B4918_32905 [Bacillus thuringiensis]
MFEKGYWLCISFLYLAGIIYVLFFTKPQIYIENTCENKQCDGSTIFCFIIGKVFTLTSFCIVLSFTVLQFLCP